MPRGHQTVTDVAIDHGTLRVALELAAERLPETGDGRFVGGKLARRQQADLGDFVQGTLAIGVEGAYRFDLVIEQIDAKRHAGAHREQVQQ